MPRCLIADDAKIIRMLLTKIMENFGFDVIEAEDGEEIISLAKDNTPELIIMDWHLPAMEGIDVLYKIRSIKKMKQPKIIFCSSIVDTDRIREALDGGADDFIIKPFDEEIIRTKLDILGLI